MEPELPGWRRAGLGDVTALESEECRAAGAPCAGPGAVAHFWSGGLGNCLKVRAEEGGRVKLPGVRDVGVEKEKRPQPARPSAAPGGGRDGGGKGGKKIPLRPSETAGAGQRRPLAGPDRGQGRDVSSGRNPPRGRPQAATAQGETDQWKGRWLPEHAISRSLPSAPGVSASWIWRLIPPPRFSPRAESRKQFCVCWELEYVVSPVLSLPQPCPSPPGWALGGNFLRTFRGGVNATQRP